MSMRPIIARALQGTRSPALCAPVAAVATGRKAFSSATPAVASAPSEQGPVTVHFLDPNQGDLAHRVTVQAEVGESIVDVAKKHGIDIHAACGQKLQCATCHVILQKPFYEILNPPGVREHDMLESAFTLTSTSRLGCQIRLTPELNGIQCTLPDTAGKGRSRMPLTQSRPRIEKQWTATPAVFTRASSAPRMAGGALNGRLLNGVAMTSGDLEGVQQQLQDRENLIARLESELRQMRGKSSKAPVNSNTEGSGQGAATDDEDLSKLKAELERTRVDINQRGRRVTFTDVIGLEHAKRVLLEAVIWPALADRRLFTGIRGTPRGILLYGPPGCGKTMIARAAALELGDQAAFFHIRPGDVMSKFYGESARRIKALEELVRDAAPAVIFLDEVDSLLGSRDGRGVAEHHRATTNALLAWMDGFDTGDERVFFLGATNRPEAIDEAALRRFGDATEVGVPSEEARLELLQHLVFDKAVKDGHLATLSNADLEAVARDTEGFSFSDLDSLTRRAFLEVLRQLPAPGVHPGLRPEDVPPVTSAHFEAALKNSTGTSSLKAMLRKRAETRVQL